MGTARIEAAVERKQDGRREKDCRNDDGESGFHAPYMARGPPHFQPAVLRRLASKHRLRPPDGFPAEIIMGAGPGVDFGLANPAFEIAGMLVLVFFPRRGIVHSATGTGKFFGGPDAACHSATMRQWRVDSLSLIHI